MTPGVRLVDPAPVGGSILGTVIDERSKQPLGDVVVTATSRGIQGDQTVVTDAEGSYRFAQLPPATYTLQFALDGFQTRSLGGIELPVNRTLRVDAELVPNAAG